jgi:hypothetical protein
MFLLSALLVSLVRCSAYPIGDLAVTVPRVLIVALFEPDPLRRAGLS